MGPTHALTGAVAWLVIAPSVVEPAWVMAGVPVAAIAALGPDIDHHKALLAKALPFISWPLRLITTHRGATHSILANIAVALLFAPLGLGLAVAAGIGYGSHIGSDMVNKEGCALFWPLSTKKIPGLVSYIPNKKAQEALAVGGPIEWIWSIAMVMALVLASYWRLTA